MLSFELIPVPDIAANQGHPGILTTLKVIDAIGTETVFCAEPSDLRSLQDACRTRLLTIENTKSA